MERAILSERFFMFCTVQGMFTTVLQVNFEIYLKVGYGNRTLDSSRYIWELVISAKNRK